MFKYLYIVSLILTSAVLISCSSDLKVAELPNSADPQTQLDIIDNNLQIAQNNQVDVLSPNSFSAAKDSRNKAVESRASNKDQKTVLHQISVAQADLDKATATAKISKQILAN